MIDRRSETPTRNHIGRTARWRPSVLREAPTLCFIALWVSLSSSGCASTELRAYEAAEADYEACLETNPGQEERCAVLEDAMRRRYDEYEARARERWGGTGSWRDRESPWGKE